MAEDKEDFMPSVLRQISPEHEVDPLDPNMRSNAAIRMVHDIDEKQVTFRAKPSAPGLDLSLASVRGCRPETTQYLQSIGVKASLTLPIRIRGKVWGFFAFHNMQLRYIGGDADLAIEFAVQYLSMIMTTAIDTKIDRAELTFLNDTEALRLRGNDAKAAEVTWKRMRASVLDSIPCCGVRVVGPNWDFSHGTCPDQSVMPLVEQALSEISDGIFLSNTLNTDIGAPGLRSIACALRIHTPSMAFMFFRDVMEPVQSDLPPHRESWDSSDIEIAEGLLRAMRHSDRVMSEVENEVSMRVHANTRDLNHRLALSTFHHQMHHCYFECNYGSIDMRWDKWFGSFRDGTVEANTRMQERRARMTGSS